MKKTLYPHQKEFLDDILESLKINDSVCAQLSTGGGKTVVFTELVSQLNSKTLVLVDSIDLVNQTVSTFKKQGLDVGCVLAGNKKFPDNKIIVAMVKSLWNRVTKNTNLLNDIQYCVIDESHVWEFNKLFKYIPNAKRIGFTATPVRLSRYKISDEKTALETMSEWYDDIVCGKPIEWLMENGYLVKELNEYIDFDASGLKIDASGEFTASSLKEVFQSENYTKSLRKTFDKLCDGKKTMIFTSSTETNRLYMDLFKDKNVRMYDSKVVDETRSDVIEWFRNERDAVLISTGVFTKGFDVDDVEVILVARATMSLSLWIQICGRGARTTNKIEKPNFLIIDGGNNNETHGEFSFDRDWKKIFSDRQIKSLLLEIIECDECGYQSTKKEKTCSNCGAEFPEKEPKEEKEQKEFLIKGKKAVPQIPTLDINFHINKGHTKFQTFKILREKWVTFLCKFDIPENNFDYHLQKGNIDLRFKNHLIPNYFKILRSELEDSKRVKYETFRDKIIIEYKKKKYEKHND